jgi:hypothetical protein
MHDSDRPQNSASTRVQFQSYMVDTRMLRQSKMVAHSHAARQIAVRAGVAPRTVIAVIEGRAKPDTVIARMTMALSELGMTDLFASSKCQDDEAKPQQQAHAQP